MHRISCKTQSFSNTLRWEVPKKHVKQTVTLTEKERFAGDSHGQNFQKLEFSGQELEVASIFFPREWSVLSPARVEDVLRSMPNGMPPFKPCKLSRQTPGQAGATISFQPRRSYVTSKV